MLSHIAKFIFNAVQKSQEVSFFTEGQLDIMYKIIKGKSTLEIADELKISQMTLHINIKTIYKTLQDNQHVGVIAKFIEQDCQ